MKVASLLSGVLVASSVLLPSLAGAEEVELLCKGNAWSTGEGRLSVDRAANRAFGRHSETNSEGWGTRVTIDGDVYLVELFDDRGRVFRTERLDMATGAYSLADKTAGDTAAFSATCEKIRLPVRH